MRAHAHELLHAVCHLKELRAVRIGRTGRCRIARKPLDQNCTRGRRVLRKDDPQKERERERERERNMEIVETPRRGIRLTIDDVE